MFIGCEFQRLEEKNVFYSVVGIDKETCLLIAKSRV